MSPATRIAQGALLILALFFSCGKGPGGRDPAKPPGDKGRAAPSSATAKKPDAPPRSPKSMPSPKPSLKAEKANEVFASERNRARPGSSPKPIKAAKLPNSGPYALCVLQPFDRVYPEHAELGPLEDEEPQIAERAAVNQLAKDFVSALAQKTYAESAVEEDRRKLIGLSLKPYLGSKVSVIRWLIGKINMENDQAQLSFALVAESSKVYGVLYLSQTEGLWAVHDIQGDFSSLDAPAGPEPKPIEPGEFRGALMY